MSTMILRLALMAFTFCQLVMVFGSSVVHAGDGSAANPYRVAMVLWRGETDVEAGFKSYMEANRVHVEITHYDVARDRTKLPEFIETIRQDKPDIVYTWGTSVTTAVAGKHDAEDRSDHITTLPIIFTMVSDPVGAGIVPSLEGTGRNVTGTAFLAPLNAQISAMAEYVGDLTSVGVIYNPKERNSVLNVAALEELAREQSFRLEARPVPLTVEDKPDPAAIPALVAELANAGVQVLYVGPDSFLAVNGETLTDAAINNRLPTFAATERPLKKAKAMMGLVSNYFTLGQFVAFKALRVLRGDIDVSKSPIDTLSRFSFMLNLDVARQIQAYPPLTMLRYAVLIGENANLPGMGIERTDHSKQPSNSVAGSQ